MSIDHFDPEQAKAVEAALAADRADALRDVFATAAMSAYIVKFGISTREIIAQHAYLMADAMIEARRKL